MTIHYAPDDCRVLGSYSELMGVEETTTLSRGMDFRHPTKRLETFIRFYRFHLRWKTHPGCVYFVLPGLAEKLGLDLEQRLWLAYLNGNTQNPLTSYLFLREAPTPTKAFKLKQFFNINYNRLAFDTDRRYQKKHFLEAVDDYLRRLDESTCLTQEQFFKELFEQAIGDFDKLFNQVSKFAHFGRLSTWSYLEYIWLTGVEGRMVPSHLMLRDRSGSKSHRNGLMKVLGRDDLDDHKSNPKEFTGDYPPGFFEWADEKASIVLRRAKEVSVGTDYEGYVNFFTLESALCTYKSWHRPNRRYPNVYADMMYNRIVEAERAWPGVDFDIFWGLREKALDPYLRLESVENDPGLSPTKQNHYINTGCPVMMDRMWACFSNQFNSRIKVKKE